MTYVYWFSEDNGRTYRPKARVSEATMRQILAAPIEAPYRRKFTAE